MKNEISSPKNWCSVKLTFVCNAPSELCQSLASFLARKESFKLPVIADYG